MRYRARTILTFASTRSVSDHPLLVVRCSSGIHVSESGKDDRNQKRPVPGQDLLRRGEGAPKSNKNTPASVGEISGQPLGECPYCFPWSPRGAQGEITWFSIELNGISKRVITVASPRRRCRGSGWLTALPSEALAVRWAELERQHIETAK